MVPDDSPDDGAGGSAPTPDSRPRMIATAIAAMVSTTMTRGRKRALGIPEVWHCENPCMTQPPHPKLDELIAVLERLRAPGGCAWAREQTHESLVQYLIEETYELVDAIESGDGTEMIEELGDVLYQVVFHSDIAAEAGRFTLEDVAAHMTQKMIGRHPHVFGDTVADTADDVMAVWDDLKKTEKPHRTSVLDGIPQRMPALALADKLLGRAHKVGLTVIDRRDATLRGALDVTEEDELGPLLLAIVASAKANGLDSERALRTALRGLQDEIREHEAGSSAYPAVKRRCPLQPEWRGHQGSGEPENRKDYPTYRIARAIQSHAVW